MAFRLALRFGCTARELLARIDSRELAEWQAFETVYGPIDDAWRDVALADIEFQLQLANAYFIQANSKNDDVPMPERRRLPWELIERREVEREDGEEN